jgi:tetratricopeptide (TPR) repeat protein
MVDGVPAAAGPRGVRRWIWRLANWLQVEAGPGGAFHGAERCRRRGRIADALDGYAQAERQYTAELGLQHSYTSAAAAMRAWCLVELGRFNEAAEAYGRAAAGAGVAGEASRHDELVRRQRDAEARSEAASTGPA